MQSKKTQSKWTWPDFGELICHQIKDVKGVIIHLKKIKSQAEYTNPHHLLCFIHFKNNIKDHLHKTGVYKANVWLILSDLFGEQVGTRFKVGIVDAENKVDF